MGGMGKADLRESIKADFREWSKADSTNDLFKCSKLFSLQTFKFKNWHPPLLSKTNMYFHASPGFHGSYAYEIYGAPFRRDAYAWFREQYKYLDYRQ